MKKYLPNLMRLLSIFAPGLAAKIALKAFATPIRIPRPESEMEVYKTSRKFFLKNGIAAFEWGESHGPLVMLIHGWNGRGTQLGAFAKLLVEKKFRVVALDGPGHGISPGEMTNPALYAQFILEAQKELDSKGAHAVIAHSFGGGCSVLAASLGLRVSGLVLVASPAFYDRVVRFFSDNFGLNEKARERFIKLITEFAGIAPNDLNIGKIGSKLNLSVLVVHDEDDNAVNILSAKAIHEAWPGSKLLITQGHRRILKDSKVLSEVSDFIGKISPTPID